MSGHDFLFYLFSLVAVGSAVVSALRADLVGAARAALLGGAAVAGLLGLAAAPLAATITGACVVLGGAAARRAGARAGPAVDAASTRASRLQSAALVTAFFAIAARSVLMVRWPFVDDAGRATAGTLPPVSLTHFVVVALALLSTGLFAALVRRSVAGVGLGLATATAAVVLMLASASRFVGQSGEAGYLAAAVAVLAAMTAAATVRVAAGSGDLLGGSHAAWRAAGNLQAVLAGVTLALLASAW